jgi:hypothetical protein
MESRFKESPDARKNLKEIYEYVFICHFCKKKYGSDDKEKHKICPVCQIEIMRGKNKEEKRRLLLRASETKPLNTSISLKKRKIKDGSKEN